MGGIYLFLLCVNRSFQIEKIRDHLEVDDWNIWSNEWAVLKIIVIGWMVSILRMNTMLVLSLNFPYSALENPQSQSKFYLIRVRKRKYLRVPIINSNFLFQLLREERTSSDQPLGTIFHWIKIDNYHFQFNRSCFVQRIVNIKEAKSVPMVSWVNGVLFYPIKYLKPAVSVPCLLLWRMNCAQ